LCRIAQVEKFDAGPKGATVSFRGNAPPNPGALVRWIGENAKTAKVRPDQKLVVLRQWDDAGQRLNGAYQLASALARLAG
jgi:transcription-repair coupling factor (superfamily II helicase)